MKLFNKKEDSQYLTRAQWAKLFLAASILILVLYISAMIASLCGSKYFILNYQNEQMDKIESWLKQYNAFSAINILFTTIEFYIVLAFILKKKPNLSYPLFYYVGALLITIFIPKYSMYISYAYPFLFYLSIPIIEDFINIKIDKYQTKINWKKYLFCVVRLLVAIVITYILQFIIFIIKTGTIRINDSIIQPLSTAFIYAVEYDIALLVILYTVLLVNREKGDSKLWVTGHNHGGSSQTSMKQSQTSLQKKNLTKTQKNKIRLLYVKFYLTQLGSFLLLMVLPFLLGKVIEFLVMYVSFAIVRYILGFKYSLHYKKESTCITVGVIVFGILALAVPFFYVVLIIAILYGIALAILLHLSYKYKGMWLFTQAAKPDKFALLYTFFDGDLEYHHVKKMCIYKGLDEFQTQLICEFTEGNKISYLAWKHNYSQRMIIYKLDEAIDLLLN